MHTSPRSSSLSVAPTSNPTDRRTRQRLRDLCDEVLWSYRIASDRELISEQERSEAQAFLSRMTPLVP